MFRFIKRTSHELIWLTILFLAFVSLLPFSTGILARLHHESTALLFYGANLELIGLSLYWLWCHATRDRRLTDPNLPESVIHFGRSRILAGVLGYGMATSLAFVNTTAALFIFLLIPSFFVIPTIQLPDTKQPGSGRPWQTKESCTSKYDANKQGWEQIFYQGGIGDCSFTACLETYKNAKLASKICKAAPSGPARNICSLATAAGVKACQEFCRDYCKRK